MKKIIIVLWLILPGALFAQDKKDSGDKKNIPSSANSTIEKFLNRPEILFKKEYFELKKVADIKFAMVKYTDSNDGSVAKGLYLSGLSTSYNNCECYLDADELPGFLRAVSLMSDSVVKTDADIANDVEYHFKTRGDFRFSTFNYVGFLGNKKKWHIICYLDDELIYRNYTMFTFDADELPELKAMLQQVITKLATL